MVEAARVKNGKGREKKKKTKKPSAGGNWECGEEEDLSGGGVDHISSWLSPLK